MKVVRFLLILAALGVASVFGYEIVNELKKPAEGTMEVVVMEEEVVMEEVTVMTEEETMEMEAEVEVPMVVEEVLEPLFTALTFTGKNLKGFAEANDGMVIDVRVDERAAELGGKKGVKVGNDIYFKGKGGALYVFHNGEIIKLN